MNQQIIEIRKRKKTDFCSNLFTVFDSKMMGSCDIHRSVLRKYWSTWDRDQNQFFTPPFYLTPLIVTDRQIDRQTEAQTNKNRQIDWLIDRQTDRLIDRPTDRQMGRQMDEVEVFWSCYLSSLPNMREKILWPLKRFRLIIEHKGLCAFDNSRHDFQEKKLTQKWSS